MQARYLPGRVMRLLYPEATLFCYNPLEAASMGAGMRRLSQSMLGALLNANIAYYDAINTADIDALRLMFSPTYPVSCIHSGAHPVFGLELIVATYERMFEHPGLPRLLVKEPLAQIYGECGVVVCQIDLSQMLLTGSNIFMLEDGIWKIVHHHTGLITDEGDTSAMLFRRYLN